jgi:arsenate reductase
MIQIYHNPRCGKSRNCVAFVETAGKEYEIIKYLENSPSTDEIVSSLKIRLQAGGVSSPKEKIWIENFKYKDDRQAIIETLRLIQFL